MSSARYSKPKISIHEVEIIKAPIEVTALAATKMSGPTPKRFKLNNSTPVKTQPILLNSLVNLKAGRKADILMTNRECYVPVDGSINEDFFLKNENNCFYKCVLCSETIKSKPSYKTHILANHRTNVSKFHIQKGFVDATKEFCTEFVQSDFNIVQSLTSIFDQIENIERIIRDHKKRLRSAENGDNEMIDMFLKDEVVVLKIYGEMIQRAFDIVSEKQELVTYLQGDVSALLERGEHLRISENEASEAQVVKDEEEPVYELYYVEDDAKDENHKECHTENSRVIESAGTTAKRGRPKGDLARTLDDSLAELPDETAEYVRSLTTNKQLKYPCNMCEVSSKTKMLLCLHYLQVHLKKKTKICPHCDRAFAMQGDLTRHIRIHSGENPFKCHYDNCTSEFKTSGDLKKHRMIHERDPNHRPHECTECDSKFARLTDLTRHKKIHLIGKDESAGFRCELCNRSFYRKDLFQSHLNRHLQIKPFECEHCLKRFAKKYDLLKHFDKQHKVVDCDDCGKSFNTRTKLINHFNKGKCKVVECND